MYVSACMYVHAVSMALVAAKSILNLCLFSFFKCVVYLPQKCNKLCEFYVNSQLINSIFVISKSK